MVHQAECKKRGMMLIAETKSFLTFSHLSKSLGCGLALSSVSTTAEIAKRAVEWGFLWVTTHQNDPLAVPKHIVELFILVTFISQVLLVRTTLPVTPVFHGSDIATDSQNIPEDVSTGQIVEQTAPTTARGDALGYLWKCRICRAHC